MEGTRGFLVRVETGWFKKPVITITDGENVMKFVLGGTFTVKTNKPFPERILIKD